MTAFSSTDAVTVLAWVPGQAGSTTFDVVHLTPASISADRLAQRQPEPGCLVAEGGRGTLFDLHFFEHRLDLTAPDPRHRVRSFHASSALGIRT